MKKDNLGDRMKRYEKVNKDFLIPRTPTIIRIDGKAFHSWTKQLQDKSPFSNVMWKAMTSATVYTMSQLQNCSLAYTQSDEISFLLTDWENLTTQQWFNGNIQKIVSVSASLFTVGFAQYISTITEFTLPTFDSRVFQLPKEEVCNYFIWRQQDASRNSINMLGQHYYSHKELQRKNTSQVQDMLMEKNINWNNLDVWKKRGTCIVRSFDEETQRSSLVIDDNIPIFTAQRQYIEQLVE